VIFQLQCHVIHSTKTIQRGKETCGVCDVSLGFQMSRFLGTLKPKKTFKKTKKTLTN